MITISTGGIGPMDIISGTKAKCSSKDEEKAVDAFASLMNMASTKQNQTEVVSDVDTDVKEIPGSKDNTYDYEAYSRQESVESSEDKLQNTENTVDKEDTATNDVKAIDEGFGDDNTPDKAVDMIIDIKNALMEALGITDEELETILSDMGIDITQLMLGDNLKNFVLQAMDAENVDILVNENLAKLVSDVNNTIASIIQEYGFAEPAEASEFLLEYADVIRESLKNNDVNVDNISDDSVSTTVVEELSKGYEEVEIVDVVVDEKSVSKTTNQIGDNVLSDKITVENVEHNQESKGQTNDQSTQQFITDFNQALDNTINTNANIDTTVFVSNVQEADIIRQIIDQIKVTATKEVQSMEVQLNPENLGKVYVNVEAKDGVMQAKIIAETEAAKNAIENNLTILKENFSNNQIKVEAIEVMVATYGFFQESQNGDFDGQEHAKDTSKAMGGINVNDLDEQDLSEEEELELEIMKTKGNTVSYTV